MRDWLAIIILVGIVVILVDGYRRRSRARSTIRMKLDKSIPSAGGDDTDHSSELPSGGARVRPRGMRQREETDLDEAGETPLNPEMDEDETETEQQYSTAYSFDSTTDEGLEDEDDYEDDLEDDASHEEVYEEPAYHREPLPEVETRKEPEFGDMDDEPEEFSISADVDDAPHRSRKAERSARGKSRRKIPAQVFQNELPLDDDEDDLDDDVEDYDDEDYRAPVEEVIVINVMARPGNNFPGSELLPILKHQGLRLGSMNIFHRHADTRGNGPIMFSMANMVKPGTFDMSAMDTFSTPGVSLFMQMPSPLGHMQSFDAMLTVANAIKDALDGELKDEQRSVLTRQTIEHCRQRIRDFELSQLSRNR